MPKKYTDEQKEWIRQNINEFSYPILAEKFNETFDTNISGHTLKMFCLRNDLRKENSLPHEECPIGHEFTNENGTVFVKVRSLKEFEGVLVGVKCRARKLCYETKQRVIWEQHYGKIPKGCHIIFLNNNQRDYRIENLYCIKEKYLPYMNRNNWFSTNPEITLTAIKWCEMMYATKE